MKVSKISTLFLSLVAFLLFGSALSLTQAQAQEEVSTLQELLEGDMDGNTGYRYTGNAVVIAVNSKKCDIYIQDQTSAIKLNYTDLSFDSDASTFEAAKIGDILSNIEGYWEDISTLDEYDSYDGYQASFYVTSNNASRNTNGTVEAVELLLGDLADYSAAKEHFGKLVTLRHVQLAEASNVGADKIFDGKEEYVLKDSKGSSRKALKTTFADMASATTGSYTNDFYDITGVLLPEVLNWVPSIEVAALVFPREFSDIKASKGEPETPEEPEEPIIEEDTNALVEVATLKELKEAKYAKVETYDTTIIDYDGNSTPVKRERVKYYYKYKYTGTAVVTMQSAPNSALRAYLQDQTAAIYFEPKSADILEIGKAYTNIVATIYTDYMGSVRVKQFGEIAPEEVTEDIPEIVPEVLTLRDIDNSYDGRLKEHKDKLVAIEDVSFVYGEGYTDMEVYTFNKAAYVKNDSYADPVRAISFLFPEANYLGVEMPKGTEKCKIVGIYSTTVNPRFAEDIIVEGKTIPVGNEAIAALIEENSLRIYPNPCKGTAKILLPKEMDTKDAKLEVFAADGKRIMQNLVGEAVFELNNLPIGFYVLKLSAQNKVYTTKLSVIR